jgi:hypothetical protein
MGERDGKWGWGWKGDDEDYVEKMQRRSKLEPLYFPVIVI